MLNILSRRRVCRSSLLAVRFNNVRFLTLNLTEKIVQKYAVGLPEGKQVRSGDYVSIKPAHCMSHDNSWPIATKFLALGADKVYDNRQVVNTLDHDVQNKSETNLRKYRNIENFAHKHGIDFYPAGSGIGHQIMVEQGYAFPLSLVVASDSHSNMYGGIGCLGTPVVRTDGAAIWATGQTWWQIPPVAKVELQGRLRPGVSGKDVIVALCGLFNNDEVLNHAIEFVGEAIPHIPIEDRLTIANMTTEWGALTGLFTVDKRLIDWYKSRISVLPQPHPRINEQRVQQLIEQSRHIKADSDAHYAKHLVLDLNSLSPRASGPNSVKIFNEVDTLEEKNIPINKAYLVSCTNSRLSDIKAAAKVVRGRKVAPGVDFYVAGASKQVQSDAEKSGDWQALINAGAIPLPAGCGPCIGLGTGLLEPGEVGISATNRNFKGRMGSPDALAYLASPAIVAASAIAGKISRVETVTGEPKEPARTLVGFVVDDAQGQDEAPQKISEAKPSAGDMLPGFPERISGELIFCDADNINTDGIYPGKYTYQDDVPREKMAEVCMENYDGDFGKISKAGDVIISGFNFGTGSSREQAATAILARRIPLVVAGSFGNIFFRNSINNALLTLELPKLVSLLRQKYSSDPNRSPTRRTGWFIEWDVAKSLVRVYDASPDSPDAKVIYEQSVGELGRNLQEIIVEGGLEGWVKAQMKKE